MVLKYKIRKSKITQSNFKTPKEIMKQLNELFQKADIEDMCLILKVNRSYGVALFYIGQKDWICISKKDPEADSELYFTSEENYYSTKIEKIVEIIQIEPR